MKRVTCTDMFATSEESKGKYRFNCCQRLLLSQIGHLKVWKGALTRREVYVLRPVRKSPPVFHLQAPLASIGFAVSASLCLVLL